MHAAAKKARPAEEEWGRQPMTNDARSIALLTMKVAVRMIAPYIGAAVCFAALLFLGGIISALTGGDEGDAFIYAISIFIALLLIGAFVASVAAKVKEELRNRL